MATIPHNNMMPPRPAPGGGVTLPPSQEKIQQKFDLSIALTLSTWPALTLSVQNSWGGPNSAEKRDWFAGAISDLFASTPNAETTIDVEYLEEFLLQVMNDEFEVNVEDESGAEVAAKVVGLRKLCLQGDFDMVDEMYEKWRERQARGGEKIHVQQMQAGDDNEDEESTDEEGDVDDAEMSEAPELVKVPKEKTVPKVDDEGFTEVVGKKRR
ncbi:MAG: hypothetical protein LQ339_001634 [Xanthoria mediterranea]|nr:MAG: hypothetical protein LQ339_001634 [Xanthoria mediterranea]